MKLNFSQYGITQNPKYLVIFLHGFGSDKENLIALAPEFEDILPNALFIAPNAPYEVNQFLIHGYKWFSINLDPNQRNFAVMPQQTIDEIAASNQALSSFIDEQLEKYNLTAQNLFLIGFSQGAMMSIYQSLTKDQKMAGVIAYSGRVILPEDIKLDEQIKSKPEICLIHGRQDDVVRFDNFIQGKEKLEKLQIPHEAHEINNLAHSIDLRGVEIGRNFIKKIIKR